MECEQLHGTFKIRGVGTFAIENTGDCNSNEVILVEDSVGHPTYDESMGVTEDNLLSIEVNKVKRSGPGEGELLI